VVADVTAGEIRYGGPPCDSPSVLYGFSA